MKKEILRNIFASKLFTLVFLVIGLLCFAVLYPSFYSGSGNKVNTLIASIIGIYISAFLTVFHFVWVRENGIGFKKLLISLFKALVICFVICILFMGYQYFFGSMYGGRHYQRKAWVSIAKLKLKNYYDQQTDYHRKHGAYSFDLHKTNIQDTNFKYGTANDDEVVKKFCSDCLVKANSFKLGAYSKHNGQLFFLSISNEYKSSHELKFETHSVEME